MRAIDSFLPEWDIRERHSTSVAAPPEAVLAAARDTRAREVPLLVALMAVRGLPALLSGKWKTGLDRPILGEFLKSGFVSLADEPEAIVLGGVGRFWRPAGDVKRVHAEGWAAWSEPGFAKVAFDFEVFPEGRGTTLRTETRIRGTDAAASRNFGRYWRVIGPGSAAIRVMWLRAVKRGAERTR